MHALASKQELKNRELDLQRMVYDHRRAIDESNSHITGQFETMNTRIKHAFELMKSTTAAVDTAKTERLNLNREIDMYKQKITDEFTAAKQDTIVELANLGSTLKEVKALGNKQHFFNQTMESNMKMF